MERLLAADATPDLAILEGYCLGRRLRDSNAAETTIKFYENMYIKKAPEIWTSWLKPYAQAGFRAGFRLRHAPMKAEVDAGFSF